MRSEGIVVGDKLEGAEERQTDNGVGRDVGAKSEGDGAWGTVRHEVGCAIPDKSSQFTAFGGWCLIGVEDGARELNRFKRMATIVVAELGNKLGTFGHNVEMKGKPTKVERAARVKEASDGDVLGERNCDGGEAHVDCDGHDGARDVDGGTEATDSIHKTRDGSAERRERKERGNDGPKRGPKIRGKTGTKWGVGITCFGSGVVHEHANVCIIADRGGSDVGGIGDKGVCLGGRGRGWEGWCGRRWGDWWGWGGWVRVDRQWWEVETGDVVVGGHSRGRREKLVRGGAWSGGSRRAGVGLGGHRWKDGAVGDGVIGGEQRFDILVNKVASGGKRALQRDEIMAVANALVVTIEFLVIYPFGILVFTMGAVAEGVMVWFGAAVKATFLQEGPARLVARKGIDGKLVRIGD